MSYFHQLSYIYIKFTSFGSSSGSSDYSWFINLKWYNILNSLYVIFPNGGAINSGNITV